MAARTRKQAKRDVTLLEAAASAGAVAGLLVPVAGHAGRRCPVRAPSCLGQTLVNAAEPYVMHTLAGALVAAAVALVALLAWRHRGVAPRRDALQGSRSRRASGTRSGAATRVVASNAAPAAGSSSTT